MIRFIVGMVAIAALFALIGVACDTGIHPLALGTPDAAVPPGTPDAMLSARCQEALSHSDYPWLRDNVFQLSCGAFSSCHQGSAPAGGLDLTTAGAFASLVGVAATTLPDWVRVVPGDPDHSYVMVKIGGVSGPLGDGGLMPMNGMLLCQEKIDAVRRWIAAGAPADGDAGAVVLDADPGLVLDGGTGD